MKRERAIEIFDICIKDYLRHYNPEVSYYANDSLVLSEEEFKALGVLRATTKQMVELLRNVRKELKELTDNPPYHLHLHSEIRARTAQLRAVLELLGEEG